MRISQVSVLAVLMLGPAAAAPVMREPPALAAEEAPAEPDLQHLIEGQRRAPEPPIHDPGRGAREKDWLARCMPQLAAAREGMRRYVYAHADCAGGALN
jgi:hypothetical protein